MQHMCFFLQKSKLHISYMYIFTWNKNKKLTFDLKFIKLVEIIVFLSCGCK